MYIPTCALPGLRVVEKIRLVRQGRPPLPQSEWDDRGRVGQLLKKLRKEKGYTQQQCAHALGISSPAAIGNIEGGRWYNRQVIEQLTRFLVK